MEECVLEVEQLALTTRVPSKDPRRRSLTRWGLVRVRRPWLFDVDGLRGSEVDWEAVRGARKTGSRGLAQMLVEAGPLSWTSDGATGGGSRR
ncbi:hypothetical protein MA16_Dca026866 [Dendrobium catenatum]|uniref:Uncharacterized protein n=1 Tax=Dendrobium catenatum TaxID=906689 RepID=A0A2I0W7X0_9ASPA|nr:hypothetical protein MA16_Dca026866 [Dendrobium catenatum]